MTSPGASIGRNRLLLDSAKQTAERGFRGAGCDERCLVVRTIVVGVFGRSDLLLHDPSAHEAYGRWMQQWAVPGSGHAVVTGTLTVNLRSLDVAIDGVPIALPARELRLLCVLASQVGRLVPYDEIVTEVWGHAYLDVGGRRARMTALNRLRGALGRAAGLIVTVPSMGLRLDEVPAGQPPRAPVGWAHKRIDGWAMDWERCRACVRTDRPHNGRGLCSACHHSSRDDGRYRKDTTR